MLDNTTMTAEKFSLLTERTAEYGGQRVTYSFYSIETRKGRYYAVEACGKEEDDMMIVGKEYDKASSLYERLVAGYVTPETLFDIVTDEVKSRKY